MTLNIDLRVAKIPFIGYIAVHYWFVIEDEEEGYQQRWEVWQNKNLVPSSWGHLHQNLMTATRGVGNGESWLEIQWQGEEAQNLRQVIQETPLSYPYNNVYRYYPGPNSNTYVQWVLDRANIDYPLSWRGWGKYFDRQTKI